MEEKRFRKNDEGFICDNCGKKVVPLGKSSRDHCPYCLYSKHIDIFPGDRKNPCGGTLMPIQSYPDAKKGFIIEYICKKCGEKVRCKAALEGNSPDDTDEIIRLTVNQKIFKEQK